MSVDLDPANPTPARFLDRDDLTRRARNLAPTPGAPDSEANPSTYHDWIRGQVAVTMEKISRGQRIEAKLRERACLNARVNWDSDRMLDAERLGSKIADDPAGTVAALRRTPQGCGWLLKRWALLAYTADREKTWTLDQMLLATRMMGTPVPFQNEANPLEHFAIEGRRPQSGADLAAFARLQIQELKQERDRVTPLDAAAKLLAERDELGEESETADHKSLKRQERGLYLRLRWLVRQLEGRPEPERKVEAAAEVVEAPKEEEKPESEAVEDVQERTGILVTSERVETKLQKAENRRKAKERKLERLRA